MCLEKFENKNQYYFLLGVKGAVSEWPSHFILTNLDLFSNTVKKKPNVPTGKMKTRGYKESNMIQVFDLINSLFSCFFSYDTLITCGY